MIKSSECYLRTFNILITVMLMTACQINPSVTPISTSESKASTPTIETAAVTPEPTGFTPTVTLAPTENSAVEPLPEVELSLLNGLELTILHPWINEQAAAFEELVEDFNTSNTWGLTMEAVSLGGFEAVGSKLASDGLENNLVIAHGFDLAPLAETGAITDLRPYFNDTEWGVSGIYSGDSVFAEIAPSPKVQAPLWFLPIAYQPGLIYYNQSWANELGFSAHPTTPETLKEQLLTAFDENLQDNNLDNNGTGGLWIADTPASALSWYSAFSGSFPEDVTVPSVDPEAAGNSFTYLKTLFVEDASWVGVKLVPYDYFTERLTLAYEGTLDDLPIQEGNLTRAGSNDTWLTLPYPSEDGKGSIAMETISVAVASGEPETQLGSWLFARWLLSPEVQKNLVEAHGCWPVIDDPNAVAGEYAKNHPAWASAIVPGVKISLAPEGMNWAFSRLVLQDAVKRVYQLDAEYLPTILDMLDSTLMELGSKQTDE